MSPSRGRPQAIEWAWLAVGIFLVFRYRWLMDDAFVYFRYVDNLLFLKIGLVNNPGEYVEGFSSPLWISLLIALRALRIPYEPMILGIALALLAAVWAMLVALRREQVGDAPSLNLPMALLLPNYAVLSYFTSGVDTPLVLLAGAAYALFVYRPGSAGAGILVALSPLIRHELVLPLGIAVLWAWRVQRRLPWRVAGIAAGTLAAWMVFRVIYYADFFPVTFHLKNEFLPAWGWIYLQDTLRPYHVSEVLAAGALLAGVLAARRVPLDGARRGLLLLLALPVVLYVIKIGGDARHFRYLAFPYVLVMCALGGLPEAAWRAFRLPAAAGAMPAVALALGLLTFSFHPRQLDRHPLREGVRHRMVDRITEAQLHRDLMIPRVADWAERVTPEALTAFRDSPRFHDRWPVEANDLCLENYVWFDRRIVHSYGLTDALLARMDVPSVRPGHKDDLVPISGWMAKCLQGAPTEGPHTISESAGRPGTPAWVAENADAIRKIERKVANSHDPAENLGLALETSLRLRVPSRLRPR